ncbi:MAG TPA: protein kinase [Kofleriaceae bacterium]|nr:protein kinase [Kofleriaceae bacterium]
MLGAVLGNYRVIGVLGEGGMGVVYVGRHETLGRRVVVKVLRPDMSGKADMLQRFFNEAQAATAINNPGIAQVFDYGLTPDGQAYFVMELLEGETLSSRLRNGPLDPVECCRIGRQIANVLQAAHAAGITHRDLKPDNLFLVPDAEVSGGERVKVLDFGLAKLANEARPVHTRTGLVMGTPSYMSPEQCRGIRNADARSDIYSLGCILFKMACGRAPFVGEAMGDIIVAHVQEPAPDPQQLAPHLPAGLAALIAKMLAKHPDSRPQTMAAVSQAFDEILSALGVPPPRTSAPLPATPPPRTSTPLPATALPRTSSPLPATVLLSEPASTPAPPEDPPSLTLAEPIPLTLDDTLLASPADDAATTPRSRAAPEASSEPELAPPPSKKTGAVETSGPTRRRMRRRSLLLAGLVVAGVAITIPLVLAIGGSGSPARPSPDREVDTAAFARARTANELEAACRALEEERQWAALERCAEELKRMAPDRAAPLRERALLEAKSASRVAAVEAALRRNNLKRAKAELESVWPESVEHPDIKRRYVLAEAQAINDLAAELARVRDADCRKYNALLKREQARKPENVTEEAARRTPCTPPPKCDAAALAREGQAQLDAGERVASFMSHEAAYACSPTPARALKAFTLACNLRNVDRARVYWKQLAPAVRTQALGACARNGITKATLSAP